MEIDEAREIIAKKFYGYREDWTGVDCNGENNSLILVPPGQFNDGYTYPPKGAVSRFYHVPNWHKDSRDFESLMRELLRARWTFAFCRDEVIVEKAGIEQGCVWDWSFPCDFKGQLVIAIAMLIEEEERVIKEEMVAE